MTYLPSSAFSRTKLMGCSKKETSPYAAPKQNNDDHDGDAAAWPPPPRSCSALLTRLFLPARLMLPALCERAPWLIPAGCAHTLRVLRCALRTPAHQLLSPRPRPHRSWASPSSPPPLSPPDILASRCAPRLAQYTRTCLCDCAVAVLPSSPGSSSAAAAHCRWSSCRGPPRTPLGSTQTAGSSPPPLPALWSDRDDCRRTHGGRSASLPSSPPRSRSDDAGVCHLGCSRNVPARPGPPLRSRWR